MKVALLIAALVSMAAPAFADGNTSTTKEKLALTLLKQMPVSAYGNRQLCIYMQDRVIGVYSPGHWSQGMIMAFGTLDKFPMQYEKMTETNQKNLKLALPLSPSGWSRLRVIESDPSQGTTFYATTGTVFGQPADACVYEGKAVLE